MGIVAKIEEITTPKQARDLASIVLNPQRRTPVIVISLPTPQRTPTHTLALAGTTAPRSGVVDVDDLAAQVGSGPSSPPSPPRS